MPHPFIPQGLDVAKTAVIALLDKLKHPVNANDRELLRMVARTSLRTKVSVPVLVCALLGVRVGVQGRVSVLVKDRLTLCKQGMQVNGKHRMKGKTGRQMTLSLCNGRRIGNAERVIAAGA